MTCPICNGIPALVKGQSKTLEFRKEFFTVNETYYLCENCGEKIVDTEMGDLITTQLYNQYREKYNLMFPIEITELREKYGLSKTKLSLALGWGENTYSAYEKGALPNESHNAFLRLISEPRQFLRHIKTSKASSETLSELEIQELERKIYVSESINVMNDWIFYIWPHKIKSDTGYTKPNLDKFINMVLFFLSYEEVFKTKLNKLLFYAEFYHYKRHCVGISGSRFRAITLGPVPSEYDAIYNWLCKKNYFSIEEILIKEYLGEKFVKIKDFQSSLFNDEEINSLKFVSEKFKNFSSTQLKDYSHEEKAWLMNKEDRKIISYQDYAFDLSI